MQGGEESIEGILLRHVHDEKARNETHTLAVSTLSIRVSVGPQNSPQWVLSRPSMRKELMPRKCTLNVLLYIL